MMRTVITQLTLFQVRMSDLSSVDINWKTLTNVRPENKMEEEFFSKLGFCCENSLNFLSMQACRVGEVDSGYQRYGEERVG